MSTNEEQSPLGLSLDDLVLRPRTLNCLHCEGITTVEELVSKTPGQLLTIVNFGREALKEVEQELDKLGLRLAGEPVRAKSKEEYEAFVFKHFVPEIKSMQKHGMDAQQISDQLRFSKALRFTHERRKPCLQTIESIMNSKMYS